MIDTVVLLSDEIESNILRSTVLDILPKLGLTNLDKVQLLYNYPSESYCKKYGLDSSLVISKEFIGLRGLFGNGLNFFEETKTRLDCHKTLLKYIEPLRASTTIIGIISSASSNTSVTAMIRDLIVKDFNVVEITLD